VHDTHLLQPRARNRHPAAAGPFGSPDDLTYSLSGQALNQASRGDSTKASSVRCSFADACVVGDSGRHTTSATAGLASSPPGVGWARIGDFVGQRNLSVTADTYTHVLLDETELSAHSRRRVNHAIQARWCRTRAASSRKNSAIAGDFEPSNAR
jgi:hypothetical protein